jgi:hypothetical protein
MRKTMLLGARLGAGAVLAAGALLGATVNAQAAGGFTATLQNGDGVCLTSPSGAQDAGTAVQALACGTGNQSWTFTPAAGYPAGYYTVSSNNTYGCLGADPNSIPNNGTNVMLQPCNNSYQTWLWNGSTLVNAYGGQCLNGDPGSTFAQLWSCDGSPSQSWTLR